MKSMTKKVLLSSLVFPCLLGAQSASAVLIEEFAYEVVNNFQDVQANPGAGEVVVNATQDEIVWGTGPQSSVSITPTITAPGGLFTNGASVTGAVFTHNNSPIPVPDATLASFDLNTTLYLTPVNPAGDALGPQSVTFNGFFSETLNQAPCVVGSESICDDVFTLDNVEELGGREVNGAFEFNTGSFTIEDYNYTVFLQIMGLETLMNDACLQAGASPNCVGFLTEEGAVNTWQAEFRIVSDAVDVPEPGTLALLGLGLVGLGLSRRKTLKS